MASISGYDSSSLGVLFSSLNRNNTTSSLLGGGSDLLGINYSDYATIRNGSYFKLLSAYYSKSDSTDSATKVSPSISTAKDDAKTLTRIESAAESTEKSLSKLTATGKDSVFNKVEKTAEDGTKTQEYDRDAIYKAVKSYVDDYNSLLDRADDSKTKSILRAANSLKSNARANEKTLEKAGITVDADGRLSVDEKSFEKADMDKLKSLFTTHGSYATQTNVDLLKIASNAKRRRRIPTARMVCILIITAPEIFTIPEFNIGRHEEMRLPYRKVWQPHMFVGRSGHGRKKSSSRYVGRSGFFRCGISVKAAGI